MLPSLRNGFGAFSSVPVGLFFSTLLDWFCDDFAGIPGSVPPSSRFGIRVFSSVPVGLFFSTLVDWFCIDFDRILGSVSSATLGIDSGAFSTVSAALFSSTLLQNFNILRHRQFYNHFRELSANLKGKIFAYFNYSAWSKQKVLHAENK